MAEKIFAYILIGNEDFENQLLDSGIRTGETSMLKIEYNSKLGKEIEKEILKVRASNILKR